MIRHSCPTLASSLLYIHDTESHKRELANGDCGDAHGLPRRQDIRRIADTKADRFISACTLRRSRGVVAPNNKMDHKLRTRSLIDVLCWQAALAIAFHRFRAGSTLLSREESDAQSRVDIALNSPSRCMAFLVNVS